MTRTARTWTALGTVTGVFLLAFLIWYGWWVHYIPQNEQGYMFNKFTGKIEMVSHNGWIIATPWKYNVHSTDLRPGQVCMNANSRVLNCKLVKFDTRGFDKFMEWHGPGAGDRGYVYEILKSYAFNVNEGRDCPFLIILDDMRRKDSMSTQVPIPIPTPTQVTPEPQKTAR